MFNVFDWFKKKVDVVEDVVEDVVDDVQDAVEDVVSIVSGPIMKELMIVADKVIENGNNPVVVAALAKLGINAIEIELALRAFQVVRALVTKVEVVVQAQAVEHDTQAPNP